MTGLTKIEYQVRKVERYIVTRYEEGNDEANKLFAGSVSKGEYDNADVAYEVAYALAQSEHDALGWPEDDERIQYPRHPHTEDALADKPSVDDIATAMRKALSLRQIGNLPVPWSKANPEAKAEWRMCAEIARNMMETTVTHG